MSKVKIIVPAYNQPQHLVACLKSLLSQSFDNFIVQIIDDCSPHPLIDFIPIEILQDPRFSLKRNIRNLGGSETLRRAIREENDAVAYVLCLLHDDVLNSSFLEKLVDIMDRESEVTFAYSLISRLTSEGELTGDFPTTMRPSLPTGVYDLSIHTVINCWTIFSSALIRVSSLKAIGYFESWLDRFDFSLSNFKNKGEGDLYIFARLASLGKVAVIDERLCYYRINNDSTTNSDWTLSNHYQDNIRTYDLIFGDIEFFPTEVRLAAKINSISRIVLHCHPCEIAAISLREGTFLSREVGSIRGRFIKVFSDALRTFVVDDLKRGFPRCYSDKDIDSLMIKFGLIQS